MNRVAWLIADTEWAAEFFWRVVSPPLTLLLLLLVPVLLFGLIVHVLEILLVRRLSARFGWRSVLWTGWLGVPVHELSHAAACVVFGHEVQQVVLFRPDPKSQRLGYVIHTYRRGNRWQELGNVFIAMAPLAGGTLCLLALLWALFPDVVRPWFEAVPAGEVAERLPGTLSLGQTIWGQVQATLGRLFQIDHLLSFRFWIFLYLTACIACHMAPSEEDYAQAWRGGWLLLALLLACASLAALLVPDPAAVAWRIHAALVPLHVLLLLALLLCGAAAILVFLVTERWRRAP